MAVMKKIYAAISALEMKLAWFEQYHALKKKNPVDAMRAQHAMGSGGYAAPDHRKHMLEKDLDTAHGSGDWFAKMSDSEKREYLQLHPNSKHGHAAAQKAPSVP